MKQKNKEKDILFFENMIIKKDIFENTTVRKDEF
jgi:hypothetical protein